MKLLQILFLTLCYAAWGGEFDLELEEYLNLKRKSYVEKVRTGAMKQDEANAKITKLTKRLLPDSTLSDRTRAGIDANLKRSWSTLSKMIADGEITREKAITSLATLKMKLNETALQNDLFKRKRLEATRTSVSKTPKEAQARKDLSAYIDNLVKILSSKDEKQYELLFSVKDRTNKDFAKSRSEIAPMVNANSAKLIMVLKSLQKKHPHSFEVFNQGESIRARFYLDQITSDKLGKKLIDFKYSKESWSVL